MTAFADNSVYSSAVHCVARLRLSTSDSPSSSSSVM